MWIIWQQLSLGKEVSQSCSRGCSSLISGEITGAICTQQGPGPQERRQQIKTVTAVNENNMQRHKHSKPRL